MMYRGLNYAMIALLVSTVSLSARDVSVLVDMKGKGGDCVYRLDYTSRGNFKDKAGTDQKTTGVSCLVRTSIADSTNLSIILDSVKMHSTLYNNAKVADITSKLLETDFTARLVNGMPTIDTISRIPGADYIAWDLYRQLVKLLPSLPEKNIKPGYTWEDVAIMPMQTAAGNLPCELYRFYTFKKLKGDTATIVWNFRFSPTDNAADGTNALEEVPIGGKGSGTARIDIKDRRLISADMGFSTPVAKIGAVSVNWQERAVFTFKYCK